MPNEAGLRLGISTERQIRILTDFRSALPSCTNRGQLELRACAEITSHFAAGPQARWQGASDEHTGLYVRSEQRSLRAAARRGAAGGHLRRCRSSTMAPHRLRRGALHLPARRSRQNVKLFLRRPLGVDDA